MAHIILLGTSHIAEQSVKHLRRAMQEYDPDIIAIELDKRRLHALLTDQKPNYSPAQIRHIGLKGYLFALIGGYFQKKMGRMVGMQPGADMKTAAQLAMQHEKQLLLMDRDITITLRRLSKAITGKEKRRFLSDLLFGRWKKQPKVAIDLANVPEQELITTLLTQIKGRYPSFYEVLVNERNHHMVRQLLAAARQHPDKKILAVVGAGHIAGMQELLARAAKHS